MFGQKTHGIQNILLLQAPADGGPQPIGAGPVPRHQPHQRAQQGPGGQ